MTFPGNDATKELPTYCDKLINITQKSYLEGIR